MSIAVAEQELYRSCRILFGSELEVGREFLNYLRHSGLKKAYRLRARQTHPDLAAANQPGIGKVGVNDFISVRQAYEYLSGYLDRRDLLCRYSSPVTSPPSGFAQETHWRDHADQFRARTNAAPHYQTGAKPRTAQAGGNDLYSRLYHGAMPQFQLRLGNFMYYSGLIDWMTVARALIWQRSQRPRLGELARRLGWLTEEEIRQVLIHREFMEKFGTSAVRRQNLTEKQLVALVGYQKNLQKKLGAFFLEQGLFTPVEMQELLRRQRVHNAACPGPASA